MLRAFAFGSDASLLAGADECKNLSADRRGPFVVAAPYLQIAEARRARQSHRITFLFFGYPPFFRRIFPLNFACFRVSLR